MTETDTPREQERLTIDSSELLRRAMGLSALDMANTDTLPRLTRQQVTGEEASRLERIHALLDADQNDLAPHIISFDEWSDPDNDHSHPSKLLGTALHFLTPEQHHILHVLSQTRPATLVPFLEFLHATFRGGNEGPRFYQIAHRRLYRLRMAMHGLSSTATATLDLERPETVRAFYASIGRTFSNQALSESVSRAFEAMVISIDDPDAAQALAPTLVQRPRGNNNMFIGGTAPSTSYITEYNAAARGTQGALWNKEAATDSSEPFEAIVARLAQSTPETTDVSEIISHFQLKPSEAVDPEKLRSFLNASRPQAEAFLASDYAQQGFMRKIIIRQLFGLPGAKGDVVIRSTKQLIDAYKQQGAEKEITGLAEAWLTRLTEQE